jgi:hypothetical protein
MFVDEVERALIVFDDLIAQTKAIENEAKGLIKNPRVSGDEKVILRLFLAELKKLRIRLRRIVRLTADKRSEIRRILEEGIPLAEYEVIIPIEIIERYNRLRRELSRKLEIIRELRQDFDLVPVYRRRIDAIILTISFLLAILDFLVEYGEIR